MKIEIEKFGITKDGQEAHRYRMRNQNGMEVVVSDFGASILQILVPDRAKRAVDVVLGLETLEGYYDNDEGFGAFVGRNANRIAGASVTIQGKEYPLEANDGPNNLHSGSKRSNYELYEAECMEDVESVSVEFYRLSPAMEQGFPGNLDLTVSYTLTEDNELIIEYFAVSDEATVVNLTNHSYFNLSGHESGSVLDQFLTIYADAFTPTDDLLIPTGELQNVEGTPMDFRTPKRIGKDIEADYQPLKQAGGYDHNYVLKTPAGEGDVIKVAELYSEKTGIKMSVFTDMCGLQVYSGNFIDHKTGGKGGVTYEKRDGICFETQYFPNACKEPNFVSSILEAGQEYSSATVFQFSIEEGEAN